ncbi:hypothetical protein [Rhodovulum adriaticum]|uniref:Uncharacterized protein n=1 Tax=Rhodovulum adriaticum TaxID=35804 RepID=A0A4R2NI40_RHOAD|nr:hypothetical protein [Rhodovulum adriaticum]MBK1636969.1 hypothetical protein [Rhodovulum adriaticum]TCP20912.1 hypothetical protein EV656_11533 [Rhodovulum adriaticum]
MRTLLTLIVLVVGLALAAAFTKPTEPDFTAQLETWLMAQIDAAEIDSETDPARAALLAACKLGRSQCVQVLRAMIEVEYEDRVLYSRATVTTGRQDPAICYGLFTKIVCTRP